MPADRTPPSDPTRSSGTAGAPDRTVPEPSSGLVREWTACALVRAAARFVPVPYLDDAVSERATRLAVTRTLRAHGRRYPSRAVEPLYAGDGGGFLRSLSSIPRKVLLFPVRKYTKIAGAVTGVPNDITRVLLLGRATHRRLALGELAGDDRSALQHEAAQLRTAFDVVVDEMDLQLLRGAVADGLGEVKDLTGAVVEYARGRFGSSKGDDEAVPAPEGAVAEGAEKVEQALERPEIVRLLAEFDRRMDQQLAARA